MVKSQIHHRCTFALTALVGPSSAVLMIPRAGSPRILSDEMKYAAESVEATYPPRNFSAARFEMCVLYRSPIAYDTKPGPETSLSWTQFYGHPIRTNTMMVTRYPAIDRVGIRMLCIISTTLPPNEFYADPCAASIFRTNQVFFMRTMSQ
ncbi:hypothetical protein IQ06DRAFT_91316 [Phaeosphaeriaceae sp. SRC1lsM3a]|nr:hypothetical protein IQ06DRAFT_91316 [Stagonospora sp. SRC1lsM3a]